MTGKPVNPDCRLAVDIGGTFTDVVLEFAGERVSTKVLTTPQAPDDAMLHGIGEVCQQAGKSPQDIDILLHGTTLATNALIQRTGARTALLTTEGFRDILEMGFEKRFAQYNLEARPPSPLVPRQRRYAVAERVAARGQLVTPLDKSSLVSLAAQIRADNVEALAIGFLHAYAYPAHEQEAAEILAPLLPGVSICLSSEVCPELREYERFSTTVANAYVRPLMSGYLQRLQTRLAAGGFRCPTFLMQSGGGLTTLAQAMKLPIRLVESGPAGGAILAAEIAQRRQLDSALAFDMGGTTAKIALIDDGTPQRSRRFEIARVFRDMKGSGLPVRIPVIDMVEIGAGGGSIAHVDKLNRITVGPQSAGSEPGPVAYGRGGREPTVTDANLVLGKLDPAWFAGGSLALDKDASAHSIASTIGQPLQLSGVWPAAGVVEIVEENMANAARVHAVERGKEPSEYTMIAFGGGAPLHAARLADKLGIKKVIVPSGAGVGSAIGFLRAPVSYQIVRSQTFVLDSENPELQMQLNELNAMLQAMQSETTEVVSSGALGMAIYTERQVELRYVGQGHELSIDLFSDETAASESDSLLQPKDLPVLRDRFETLYKSVYGLTMPDAQVECVSWSVTASTQHSKGGDDRIDEVAGEVASNPKPGKSVQVVANGVREVYDASVSAVVEHKVYQRAGLLGGAGGSGPAIITEAETTTVVPSHFDFQVETDGSLLLRVREGQADHSNKKERVS